VSLFQIKLILSQKKLYKFGPEPVNVINIWLNNQKIIRNYIKKNRLNINKIKKDGSTNKFTTLRVQVNSIKWKNIYKYNKIKVTLKIHNMFQYL
jgi:hypothetical protein